MPSNYNLSFVTALGTDILDVEKPVVFTYEEIRFSTDEFSDSNLLGHGTYGSVYYGLLRDQVCSNLLKNLYYITQVLKIMSNFFYLILLGSCC